MPVEKLSEFFRENPKFALAFSGGADSAYLLRAAQDAGADVRPYFFKTQFQPSFELEEALRLAPGLAVVRADVLNEPEIAANGPERCYRCKRRMLSLLIARAAADGYALVCDGTNATDDAAGRPGMRALAELGIRSPLREAGLGKAEIRRLSREAGLDTWDKPSYSCLATRVPAGTPIDARSLRLIECGEKLLNDLGFSGFRLRLADPLGPAYRLELPEGQIERGRRLLTELAERLGEVELAERRVSEDG